MTGGVRESGRVPEPQRLAVIGSSEVSMPEFARGFPGKTRRPRPGALRESAPASDPRLATKPDCDILPQ